MDFAASARWVLGSLVLTCGLSIGHGSLHCSFAPLLFPLTRVGKVMTP